MFLKIITDLPEGPLVLPLRHALPLSGKGQKLLRRTHGGRITGGGQNRLFALRQSGIPVIIVEAQALKENAQSRQQPGLHP